MPRRRKDQQAPAAAPGQAYGERQDALQAQNIIPLPDRRTLPAESHDASAPAAPPGEAVDPRQAAIQAALGTPPPGPGLTAPTARPNEPLTAGLPVGPGPGPRVGPSRAQAQSVADSLRLLGDLTGNPRYAKLAAIAAQQGV